jgi:hypothetical protein
MKRGTIRMAMTGRGRKGRESGRGTEKYWCKGRGIYGNVNEKGWRGRGRGRGKESDWNMSNENESMLTRWHKGTHNQATIVLPNLESSHG